MHLTTGEDGTYPNWEWNDLDPAMEFKLIFVPRVIQRVWSQFVSATSRFVPTSLNGKHVEPAVKQIVTEHAMRAATGDEATLFYKVMKYLQLLFFVVAILSIPYIVLVSVGGDFSLAGATTVVFDVGLVVFSLGNIALVNATAAEQLYDETGQNVAEPLGAYRLEDQPRKSAEGILYTRRS